MLCPSLQYSSNQSIEYDEVIAYIRTANASVTNRQIHILGYKCCHPCSRWGAHYWSDRYARTNTTMCGQRRINDADPSMTLIPATTGRIDKVTHYHHRSTHRPGHDDAVPWRGRGTRRRWNTWTWTWTARPLQNDENSTPVWYHAGSTGVGSTQPPPHESGE